MTLQIQIATQNGWKWKKFKFSFQMQRLKKELQRCIAIQTWIVVCMFRHISLATPSTSRLQHFRHTLKPQTQQKVWWQPQSVLGHKLILVPFSLCRCWDGCWVASNVHQRMHSLLHQRMDTLLVPQRTDTWLN